MLFQNYSSQIAGAKLNKSNVRRRKGGKKEQFGKKNQQHTHIKEHKGTQVAKAGEGPNKTSLCTEQTKSQTGLIRKPKKEQGGKEANQQEHTSQPAVNKERQVLLFSRSTGAAC